MAQPLKLQPVYLGDGDGESMAKTAPRRSFRSWAISFPFCRF